MTIDELSHRGIPVATDGAGNSFGGMGSLGRCMSSTLIRRGGQQMLNQTTLLADELGKQLSRTFLRSFGSGDQRIAALLDEAPRLVIERLATSDALYHDAEHTALVTLVAQDILRGLRLTRNVTPDDWLHFIVAALTHDVGYLRGVCTQDNAEQQVIDAIGNVVSLPRGASDAYLAPYHVFRSQAVVLERFRSHPLINGERIARTRAKDRAFQRKAKIAPGRELLNHRATADLFPQSAEHRRGTDAQTAGVLKGASPQDLQVAPLAQRV
jgi:hypothetical protein